MAGRKFYRIYIDKDSELYALLERMPRSYRGDYIRAALTAYKPFIDERKVEPDMMVVKKTFISEDVFG